MTLQKMMLVVCLLTISAMSAAVTVVEQMPSKAVLTKDLDSGGFKHFRENSAIVKRLAWCWLSESQVRLRTKRCVASYMCKYSGCKKCGSIMKQKEPELLAILLRVFYTDSTRFVRSIGS